MIVTIGAVGNVLRFLTFIPPPTRETTPDGLIWPIVKLTNISSLESLKPLSFNYPLVDTPNILVKLGVKADQGVGPDGDIVAYSDVCQHLGCYYVFVPEGGAPSCNSRFKSPGPEGYCCCHGGRYDFLHNANVVGGPPPRSVPQVKLRYDEKSGDIFAVEMGPPTIFGHGPPGTDDPELVRKYDLEGGELVTQATVFSDGKGASSP